MIKFFAASLYQSILFLDQTRRDLERIAKTDSARKLVKSDAESILELMESAERELARLDVKPAQGRMEVTKSRYLIACNLIPLKEQIKADAGLDSCEAMAKIIQSIL